MLDYDGTIAPIARRRDRAVPFPATLAAMHAISETPHTWVAVVSGRPLRELERFLGRDAFTLFGEHGWERGGRGARRIRFALPRAARAALARAARAALARGFGARLERKRAAIVYHARGLPPRIARRRLAKVAALWWPEARHGDLVLEPTRGGIELRAAGRDKGTAVRSLIAAAPQRALAMYVGDDHTDEHAFEEVLTHGFGVRVGGAARESRAIAWLADCRAVATFLERWLRVMRY